MSPKQKISIILCSLIWLPIVLIIADGVTNTYLASKGVNIADLPVIQHFDGDIKYSIRSLDYNSFEMLRACVDKGYAELCLSDLWAIAQQESGNRLNTVGVNTNGTADIGIFGINTIHKVPLECLSNVYCSAVWVIEKLEEHGYNEDRLNAIGSYHSKTPSLKAKYLNRISKYLTLK